MRWLLEYWLLVFLVPLVEHAVDCNEFTPSLFERSAQFADTFTSNNRSYAQYHGLDYLLRVKRVATVLQAPSALRLIDEKHCPEIRNLCSHLRDGNDDLSVLECVQTFLTNQIETISDDCHHTIWTHTKDIMTDGVVLKLVEKPCQTIVGK